MGQNITIDFKDKSITVIASIEMGGGTDGYYIMNSSGYSAKAFQLPYYATPERQWAGLSDFGKNNVRTHGWAGWGNEGHAIAAALNELGVTSKSKDLEEFLTSKTKELQTLEANARTEVDDLFDRNTKENYITRFEKLLADFRTLAKILKVAEELEYYELGYVVEWANWPIPETNA